MPIGAAVLWITFRSVAEGRDPTPRRIDVPGQITLIGGLFLLVLALLRGNEEGWGSAGIVAALAGRGRVPDRLRRHRGALPRADAAASPARASALRRAAVAVFAIAASFFAVFLYLTLYLQTVLGMSPIETGLVYLPGTFLVFVVSGMTAQIGARYSPAKIASLGLGLIAPASPLMLLSGVDSSWTVLLPGLLVTSIGTGLFNPTGSALALNALPDEQSGLASGANDTFRQTGVAVGIAALGTLVPADAAWAAILQSYVDGLHNALIASAGSRRPGRSRRRGCCSRSARAPSPTPSPSPKAPRGRGRAGAGSPAAGGPGPPGSPSRGRRRRRGPACSPEPPSASRIRRSGPLLTSWRRSSGPTRASSPRSSTCSSPSISSVSVPSSTR